MENGYGTFSDEVQEELPMVNAGPEIEPSAGPSGLGLFSVKSEAIPRTEAVDQIAELNALCLNVYDQKQFEDGIIEQVETAFQKQEAERQKMLAKKAIFPVLDDIRSVERRIKAIDEMLRMSQSATSNGKETKRLLESINREKTNKLKQLKGLRAKHRALVGRAEGEDDVQVEDHIVEDSELDQETVWHLEKVFGIGSSKVESETDKLIRSGKMTPFGTVTGEKGGRVVLKAVTDGPTDFEKYLLDQEAAQQQKTQRKPRAAPKSVPASSTVPAPKRQKVVSKGRLSFPAVADGVGGMELEASPSTSREHPPLIRKIKVNKKASKVEPVQKEKESSSSCSEYVPSEDDSSSDGNEPAARRKKMGSESDAESEDDSDSGVKSRRRKRALDDGCYESYKKRIGLWKKKMLKEKKEEAEEEEEEEVELEGGYRIPSAVWNKLYPYQQTCVQWLWELNCQRCGGIVGDEMGLGKTIQIIAYLIGLHNSQLVSRDNKFKGLGPVLIVAPTTIMHQWVKEFHAWWPQFRVAVLHESGSHSGTKEALVRNVNTTNGILITSYSGVAIHQVDLMRRDWHYVILDEGHKIRNPDARITLACKQFRTPHRLILSGSPVQNSLRELWSLFDFVFPGKLGTLPVFMQQFAVPITHGGYSNASSVQVQTAYRCAVMLRNTINPYLLRRMKEDVKMNVQLPGRNEQVLFCRLTDHQRELYREYLDSKEIKSILDGRLQVFVGLINLRKICNHADLYSGGPKVFANTDVEALTDEMRYGYWKRSGKMMVIAAILKLWHRQGHRVLLFSQSKQMLNILEKFVQNQGYTYARMDGSTNISTRQPMIDNFNKDPGIFVFLLTTRVGGLGVNLTGANRVVIYDPDWNPSTDLQARERAWRIGQQRDVTIYRLLTAGTIEEKIYHRQIFKQFLTNRVLKDPRQKRFFKSNDLFELFTLRDDRDAATETGAIFAGTGSEVRVDRTATNKDPNAENGKSCLSPEKIQKMKELARALSRKIVERGSETSNVGQAAAVVPKKPTRSKRKSRRKSIDGVENLVRSETFKPPTTSESQVAKSAAQDDYVLRKLLSKTGVHSALKHDVIVDTSAPDYTLVEAEAERVAREAVRELKRSRRSCLRAEYGVPTWTGNNGASGAPVAPRRPRFGAKKKTAAVAPEEQVVQQREKKEDKAFSGVVEETKPKAMSSSQLLDSIRKRNPADEEEDAAVGGARPDTRYDELLVDIRNFVAFQAAVDGQATTEELVQRFKQRLPAEDSAVFKALLAKVCEFSRCPPMDGVWRLRQEFR